MCFAIASDTKRNDRLLSRIWQQVAATPLRLFLVAAVVHLLIASVILINNYSSGIEFINEVMMVVFTYGILALVIFGLLMTWIPEICSLAPVHYGRYTSIYLLFMVSLIMIECGCFVGGRWVDMGMLVLASGWLLALRSLWNLHVWVNRRMESFSRVLMVLLMLNSAMLLFSVFGQDVELFDMNLFQLLSMIFVWPAVLIVMFIFKMNAPEKRRVISM